MTERYTCKSCGNQFRADRWRSCYNCGEPTGSSIESPSESQADESTWSDLIETVPKLRADARPKTTQVNRATTNSSPLDISQLVRAQNRTTHAVRALAYFFFIQFQTALAGSTMIGWAIGTPSNYDMLGGLRSWPSFVFIFGVLTILGGMLLSLIMGYRELDQSK